MNAAFSADHLRLRSADDLRIPVGILGDSDSHGYMDTVSFPPGTPHRGGDHRDAARQWTEVLVALRGDQVDLGDRGTWGGRRTVVRVLESLGLQRRAPRKHDHQFNLAFSGASCQDLHEGVFRQLPRLLSLMDQEQARWRRGVVICRIGIVDLGGEAQLDAMARTPQDAALARQVARCTDDIARVVAAIRSRHPETGIVLVGIFDNSDIPSLHPRWQSRQEIANIRAVLDEFDGRLRQIAAMDRRTVFFDDRAWFHARWGSRDRDGKPDYRPLVLADGIRVEHAMGDEPHNTALADGHAGLVCNTLWCQSLTQLLARQLGLPITPITDEEVVDFLRSSYSAWR